MRLPRRPGYFGLWPANLQRCACKLVGDVQRAIESAFQLSLINLMLWAGQETCLRRRK